MMWTQLTCAVTRSQTEIAAITFTRHFSRFQVFCNGSIGPRAIESIHCRQCAILRMNNSTEGSLPRFILSSQWFLWEMLFILSVSSMPTNQQIQSIDRFVCSFVLAARRSKSFCRRSFRFCFVSMEEKQFALIWSTSNELSNVRCRRQNECNRRSANSEQQQKQSQKPSHTMTHWKLLNYRRIINLNQNSIQ